MATPGFFVAAAGGGTVPRVAIDILHGYCGGVSTLQDIVRPLGLTARIFAACWPQLLLIGCLGYIVRDLLLRGAVTVGLYNPLGGMLVLSLVVLAKLMILVLMFTALRPHLPALARLRQAAIGGRQTTPAADKRRDNVLAITAAAILPFFAYYAAWGFLGDTVREYSRLALARLAAGEHIDVFGLLKSQGFVVSILLCWLVRFAAKRLNRGASHPYWRLLVVAADASWIFIGLYALDIWKDEFIRWIGAGSLLQEMSQGLGIVTTAFAADAFIPVEFQPVPLGTQAQSLFFYALLPMVWLVMAAIINGYELSAPPKPVPAPSRHATWRKWTQDFASHWLGGYRSRYSPVWTCLRLTLGTGLATLLTFIVAYRAIGWLTAWAWLGLTRLIGAHDLITWQVFADWISIIIGSPSDLDGGIVFEALRITLLAAVLEHAVATSARREAEAAEA